MDAFIWAYNETVSDDERISRYPSQKIDVSKLAKGQTEPLNYTRGGVVRPLKDDPDTWGLYVDPDTKEVKRKDPAPTSYKDAQKDFDDSRGSGGRGLSKEKAINILTTPPPDGKGLASKESDDNTTNAAVDQALKEHRESVAKSPEKQKLDKAKSDLEKSDKFKEKNTGEQIKKVVSKKMKQWEEDNPAPTHYKEKTGEDKSGNPIYKDVPIPTKNGKVTKKGKETNSYKEWQRKRDQEEYSNYRQEFYNRDPEFAKATEED